MRLVSERELIVQRMCLRRLQDSGTEVGALNSEHPQNILISYIGNKGLKKLSNVPTAAIKPSQTQVQLHS